ncbi:hypothetical protein K2Z83_16240 [Oscillochloris sp. ZM17-4]|uniref:hypothetical protein n=1 Tax=Oscillochloris sp. ZM17-4 TaxID=2866714 RepID=UPI001C732627|nr:hypothetical protein [Oscillochloris sp. ZM17-4]MBX0329224.1 hypothetical protein [Oscillochloris sp. ZM17-4]
MAKYVLIFNGGGMPETEAEQAAVMQAWGVWYEGLGSAVMDGGNPLSPMARSIASDGAVSDGANGTPASGYTIISADTMDAAVTMAKGCPILKDGGQISVYEAIEMAM